MPTPLELAIALKAKIDTRSYLPVWLGDDMTALVAAMSDPANANTVDWLSQTGSSPTQAWYEPESGEAYWEVPFLSRGIETFEAGNLEVETHEGDRLTIPVYDSWHRVYSYRKVFHEGTTVTKVLFAK